MSIRIYMDKEGNEKHNVYGVEIPQIMRGHLFILDTCILLPTILPRERRTLGNMERIVRTLHPEAKTIERNIRKRRMKERGKGLEASYMRKRNSRCIDIVNAIEDGMFYERGFMIGITDTVFSELLNLERTCKEDNVRKWSKEVKGKYAYMVSLPIGELREKYDSISKKLEQTGDFSVAMAGYLLGCGCISDDYASMHDLKRLNELELMSESRWGHKAWSHDDSYRNEFKLWDSVTLMMFLRG